MYGGILNDKKYGVHSNISGSSNSKPDVVDDRKNIHWETKATVSGDALEISESQFKAYVNHQYSMPQRRFFYSIFRHTLRNITKEKRTDEQIVKELTEKISFSLTLPLGILIALHKIKGNGLVGSYTGKDTSWQDCFLIRSHIVNRFLYEPENLLGAIGLNHEDFLIERYLSPPLTVNRRKINQFPIVKISDRSHDKWVNTFMSDYEREMEKEGEDLSDLPIFTEEKTDVPFD